MKALLASIAAFVGLPLFACGAAPGDGPDGQSSEAIIYKRLPPTLAECEAFLPTCTVSPWSWENATPGELGYQVAQREADDWIQTMQEYGCTTPVFFNTNPSERFQAVSLTMCPTSALAELPSPLPFLPAANYPIANPTPPYANLVMGCNACYPYGAPAGWTFLAWDPELNSPAGCKNGNCGGLLE